MSENIEGKNVLHLHEDKCKCVKIEGNLEAVNWLLWPRHYRPRPWPLSLADWTQSPHIWLHYVKSSDGFLLEDDVLRSKNTRHWAIDDVQRYFVGELHCEQVLFTYQYPNLKMPTRHGSYLWQANTASKLSPVLYLKELHRSVEHTLKKMEATEAQMDRLIISDQLIKLYRLESFKRKTFFRILENILSFQDHLQLVSFENLCSTRLEGVRLIQQLACFNAHSLKYLFLWRFVMPKENPVLINYSYITGSGQHIPRPSSKRCFVRSLGALQNLRILALEYSYLADDKGSALLALLPVITRSHFRLLMMCREEQTPGRADPSLGCGGRVIPDTAWRRVSIACPDLYLVMIFLRINDYDDIRRFLSPSVPLRETHLQLGIDLTATATRQHSDLSCFLRHLAFYFASTLGSLNMEIWRSGRYPLRRVLETLPRLAALRYSGEVDERDLRSALELVACGVCEHMKEISINILDSYYKRNWNSTVQRLMEEFQDIMALYKIKLSISTWNH